MKAATEKQGIHSASVHLDTILKGLNLLSHSGQHKTVACAKLIWVGASAIIVGKVKSDRMPSWHQRSYLSFDVLQDGYDSRKLEDIICDAGCVGYVSSSEF
jgi:hypothetical protein